MHSTRLKKIAVAVHISHFHTVENFVILLCCFAEDRQEMYQDLSLTHIAIVPFIRNVPLSVSIIVCLNCPLIQTQFKSSALITRLHVCAMLKKKDISFNF